MAIPLQELGSLEEIDGLALGPDAHGHAVVLVGLNLLREAPDALARLLHHQAQQDWCIRNLSQVRVAARLATTLITLESRMGELARAIHRMRAARKELESAGQSTRNSFAYSLSSVGAKAVDMAGNINFMLGVDEEKIDALLLDVGKAQRGDLVQGFQQYIGQVSDRRVPLSTNEDRKLVQLRCALTELRNISGSPVRRLGRLGELIPILDGFQSPPQEECKHEIPVIDQELANIAQSFAVSTRQILEHLDMAPPKPVRYINGCQQEVSDQLALPLLLNHARFIPEMPVRVRSVRDLEEVMQMSLLHQWEEPGQLARPVMVHLLGLNQLNEATAVQNLVDAGIEQRGWVVQGLGTLTTAKKLDDQLAALVKFLPRCLNVMTPDGMIFDHGLFTDLKTQAEEINSALFGNHLLQIAECGQVAASSLRAYDMSRAIFRSPKRNALRLHMCQLRNGVNLARMAKAVFLQGV